MTGQPELRTERLLLRPFAVADAPVVQQLAGNREIASTTLNIPHPYEVGMAEEWIGTHQEQFEKGDLATFAIVRQQDRSLIGAISLMRINQRHENAELGYWIGKPYWNNGYCTEAGRAILQYGFGALGLNRIYACYLSRNPASGQVMEKIGMVHEGCQRQHAKKWGIFDNLELYAILKAEHKHS
ncbi:MAG: GNAT family N-acetyltransferase [Chloroflexi bacterium]|nr:GNAT family N-acetyltransferase [Chloroflexota bacterium]